MGKTYPQCSEDMHMLQKKANLFQAKKVSVMRTPFSEPASTLLYNRVTYQSAGNSVQD